MNDSDFRRREPSRRTCTIGGGVIVLCLVAWPGAALCQPAIAQTEGETAVAAETVEQWDVFELALEGPRDGNPFVEVSFQGEFRHGERVLRPEGFYDGDGIYRLRLMPDATGEWTYRTISNRSELDSRTGSFTCTPASPGNHGPVRVRNTWYLAYADGTPYFQIGTTCYAWVHQGDALEEQTLQTLASSPFNKLRMCVFPKAYEYNRNEPPLYPYEGKPLREWDFSRFNPAFWRHFEDRVRRLRDLGIEADIILFHPYDRWGFASMEAAADDRYLHYAMARLAAFRNVWWSLANEFDLMTSKTDADWDRFFQIVQSSDPIGHLRGIHNCVRWYDHTKPWVTHCSIQSSDFSSMRQWREKYRKPILFDECRYEGNVPYGWGNLTGPEMARSFWLGTMGGCYVGHGETYLHPQEILWWSKGGMLHGESPARIAFLKQVMAEAPPFEDMVPLYDLPPGVSGLACAGEQYLYHFQQPTTVSLVLPGDQPFKADGIDTWNMSLTPLEDVGPGEVTLSVPRGDWVVRLSAYALGEARRPRAEASCEPSEGIAPLTVRFSSGTDLACRWDFGDGGAADEATIEHWYEKPGMYMATLTVADRNGLTATRFIEVVVDEPSVGPRVRIGFPEGEWPTTVAHGDIVREPDGAYVLGEDAPWRWVAVGDGPLQSLEGLRSFTIVGWVQPSSLTVGSGGNRIVCNLNYNRSGFDLVHLQDGRLRLAVNEWPDGVRNDSSPGSLVVGQWVFFAVSYDATEPTDNVRWYFGDAQTPAFADRVNHYQAGSTGIDSGPLAVGNYNTTLHVAGTDRQFRGRLRAIQIFGSRLGRRGALTLEDIRRLQRETSVGQ